MLKQYVHDVKPKTNLSGKITKSQEKYGMSGYVINMQCRKKWSTVIHIRKKKFDISLLQFAVAIFYHNKILRKTKIFDPAWVLPLSVLFLSGLGLHVQQSVDSAYSAKSNEICKRLTQKRCRGNLN